ncbi:Zona pellucida sperm-binding protein 3 [Collichthys lucidus]|uniref:Zona pellucida sperm-binding protein 3 n=1 Tax=Collichthys lucidus TaxID=240159 RepID=A0A4U5TXF4_COLLU|nr:Zona pellucida sperm-binding protein 3 [Collichthys lucidus]
MLPSDSFACLISEAERQARGGWRERNGGVSDDDNIVVNLWDCGSTSSGIPLSADKIRSGLLWSRLQTPLHGSEQLDPMETSTVPPQRLLVPGPDLNPPVKQESKVKFEQWVPVTAGSVAAHCGEGKVTVEVQQNFLGNGQLIRPSDLTLGGCAALHTADHILRFQTELQGCGSTMTMTEEALIYSFSLMYSPTPIGNTAILKTNPAEVVIECHYRRRHYVSSDAMSPSWKPSASVVFAAQQLNFSLRLMTEDWQSQRPSSVYFLSDVMHIEAAVHQGHHVPLRVYVDSCVATVNPDPGSEPRYVFISNHGWET